ncbi:predicted protein, partial [Scheffersomyces stipitis CBS 6054]
KSINDLILGRYYDLVDKRAEEEKYEKKRLEEIGRQDALMAARLSKSEINGPVMRARTVLAKRKKKREAGTLAKTGFNKEMVLSTELSDILGISRTSRPQVVKQLWIYIKDNELQNPDDKRQIMCDEKLQKLFKKSMCNFCLEIFVIFSY